MFALVTFLYIVPIPIPIPALVLALVPVPIPAILHIYIHILYISYTYTPYTYTSILVLSALGPLVSLTALLINLTIADIVKFKKPKKGGKDTPRVAAPSGTKKFGTSAIDDYDVDDNPIDTSSAAEPVVSLLLRKLRSTTRPENSE